MNHKTIKAATTATDRGEFTALAATYAIDRVGDRIVPGAFAKTIDAWKATGRNIPLHWDHSGDAEDIIGWVDPASMMETEQGLYVKGQLDLEDSEVAREAWRSMKNNAVALSFGYLSITERKAKDGINELLELDLYEVSIVSAPANPDTRLLSLKAIERNGTTVVMAETEPNELEELAVEDGSDEEPSEVKSAPQDPLKKRSMELALEIARDGVPRYEPEVKAPEPEISVSELRRQSFEAILETVRD